MGDDVDDGWVPLGRLSWVVPFARASPVVIAPLCVSLVNANTFVTGDLPVVWRIVILVGIGAASCILVLAVTRLLYPRAYVNPTTSTIRFRGRAARYSQITSAQLIASTSGRRRTLSLLLRSGRRLRGAVPVRDAREIALDSRTAALVADMIRASHIEMPKSPDDPKGRFAKYNFPGYVTREEALELIEHPPAFGDPLPIPPPV